MTAADRAAVLALLHEERFVDLPPAQVWAQVLDAGQVPPCSIRTMYRVLAANAEVRERRNQLRHPAYHKPELLATGPNQVWSWDITKLLGPVKWTYYYLYVLLDIFSRYVVGWLLARQESGRPGQGADRRELRAPAHRPGPAHHPCRPRAVDDLAARGPAPGHPRRGALALPPPRLRRQPLLRGAVQDPQVPARLPGPVRRPTRTPRRSASGSSLGTTASIVMAPLA